MRQNQCVVSSTNQWMQAFQNPQGTFGICGGIRRRIVPAPKLLFLALQTFPFKSLRPQLWGLPWSIQKNVKICLANETNRSLNILIYFILCNHSIHLCHLPFAPKFQPSCQSAQRAKQAFKHLHCLAKQQLGVTTALLLGRLASNGSSHNSQGSHDFKQNQLEPS